MQVNKVGNCRRNMLFAVLAALAIITMSGCGSADSSDKQATPSTASSTYVPVAPDATEVSEADKENIREADEALRWLQSDDRATAWRDDVEQAGRLLISSINQGKFGTVRRLDADTQPMPKHYTGPGVLVCEDGGISVGTYLSDGVIQQKRPILSVLLNANTGDDSKMIHVAAPRTTDISNDELSFWRFRLEHIANGKTVVSSVYAIWSTDANYGQGTYHLPTSFKELMKYDVEAHKRFDGDMSSWYGANWRQIK